MNYDIIRDYVLKFYDGAMKNIMMHRLEAVYQYWSGNVENVLQELRLAIHIAQSEDNIPRWMVNDIAIDMRNVQILRDNIKGGVNLYPDGQKILDKDNGYVYNPVIDRVTANYFEKISEFEMKRKIQSPYTVNFGGIDLCLEKLVDVFIVALQYGSIVHMELIRNKLLDFLMNVSLRDREHNMYLCTVELLILDTDSKILKDFMQTYGESTNHLNSDDVFAIFNSVERIKIPMKKILAESLLLQHFGYYMSEDLFNKFIQAYLKDITKNLKEHKLSSAFVPGMLTALENCQFRLELQCIMKICYLIFDEGYKRWYNDVFKLLKNISVFDGMPEKEKQIMITWMIKQLKNKEIVENCSYIGEAAQRIRQSLGEKARCFDEIVKKYIPGFYDNIYSLNVLEHDVIEDWRYIHELLEEIEKQNETQGKQGKFSKYAFNNYNIISKIVINDSVVLNTQQIKNIIKVMRETLLSTTQSYEAKFSALYLLEVLQLKNTKSKQIQKLLTEIQNMDALWEGEEMFDPAYSKELLVIQLELLKILVYKKYNPSDRIISLCLSLTTACQITLLDNIYQLISANSEDKTVEHLVEVLWPVFLTLEQSQNVDVKFEVGIIYANLCNSKYQNNVLSRISVMLDDATYAVKVGVISRLKEKCSDCESIKYILQKGRVDNHYWVRRVSE